MRKTSLIFSIVALFVFCTFWGGIFFLSRFFPNTQERLERKAFHSTVVLNRDRYGVPVIESDSRIEVIKAQGLATARDRFFQMELIRRKMAGRLSELFGEKALETDEWHRRLGFESVAQKSVSLMDSSTREVWESYAQGVNDYLSHETLPWEISLLGYTPEPWRAEDSILVVLSLFDALNDPKNGEELAYNELNRVFPKKLVNFLTWDYGFFDAPLRIPKGFSLETKVPTPVEWNVRSQSFRSKDISMPEKNINGSNAWVVSGTKTVTGKPLLAGDPHLNLSVPNIWYRSELKSKDLSVRGVTVPGIPGIVIGRNENIAWSFTNSRADVHDFIEVGNSNLSEGEVKFGGTTLGLKKREESIRIKGQPNRNIVVWDSSSGPVLSEKNDSGKSSHRILQWTALDPVPLSKLNPLELDSSKNLDEMWDSLSRWGGPVLNILVASKDDHLAWGMVGKIPTLEGRKECGKVSAQLTEGLIWKGYIPWQEMPRVTDPKEGFLVSGNQNMWVEPMGREKWGHDWPSPVRGYEIVKRLSQEKSLSVQTMESIQNDIYAIAQSWYRDQFVTTAKTMQSQGRKLSPWLEEILKLVGTWDGNASINSAAYRFLREYRFQVQKNCIMPFIQKVDPNRREEVASLVAKDSVIYQMVTQRPFHLLNPEFSSWEDLFLASAVQTAEKLVKNPEELKSLTWGKKNVSQIKHPFAARLPEFLGKVISFPELPLSGDALIVRVNKPSNGASMRMVIDMSDFKNSRFSQPGGQSGYFLSSHYQDLFQSWYMGQGVEFESSEMESHQVISGNTVSN